MRSKTWLTGGATLLVIVAASGAAVGQSTALDAAHAYGDVLEITPDVRLIIGRPLDAASGEVDVANALLYNSDGTLVVVDTGGKAGFVPFFDEAAGQPAPFDEVLLVSTHGHADHVGNNAWIDTLGVPASHYMSAHDLNAMRDPVGYFANGFAETSPYLADAPPAGAFAQQIVDMFGGIDSETSHLTVLESLPLHTMDIGGTSWDGWNLLDGDVQVLRTSGHTAGQVVVFLPGPKLLHLSDETTGYYQVFPDASPAANLLTLQRAANAVADGSIDFITDGHTFAVRRGDEAVSYLSGLIDAALAYDAAVSRLIASNEDGITIPDLVAAISTAPEMAGVPGGANDMPIFGYMQILNKLRELGIAVPDDPGAPIAFRN
jgi:glyoxylase-like metal-dependent hydrolase (beta-lactamase superfamily II)